MQQLNPTLWRTCRMLAGTKRIIFLRLLLENPERTVSDLAQAAGVGESDASQELRRIQSRGLLRRQRRGLMVFYRLQPDPQVVSAAPILKALKAALAMPPDQDGEIIRIARALANENRIRIVRELMQSPQKPRDLQAITGWWPGYLRQQMLCLIEGGFVRQTTGRQYVFQVPPHPLARALVKLLRPAGQA